MLVPNPLYHSTCCVNSGSLRQMLYKLWRFSKRRDQLDVFVLVQSQFWTYFLFYGRNTEINNGPDYHLYTGSKSTSCIILNSVYNLLNNIVDYIYIYFLCLINNPPVLLLLYATWNVSSMVSRSGEVVDALHRRKIDFCYAQETRWKVEIARMLGDNGRRYKFFWQGCNKRTAGVGMFIAKRWNDSVVNVVRVNERIMYVKLVIGKQIVNIVSVYAPQVGLSSEEKDDFWDSLIIVLSGIPK